MEGSAPEILSGVSMIIRALKKDLPEENTFGYPTTETRTFRITSPDGGWNEITIKDGSICISDADCPDKTCVKTGILRSESLPIVCLPHKLVIRLEENE